jgi:hypothetical protein
VLACLLISASLALAEDTIPDDVRKALESAMQDKVGALLKEKDAAGNNFKRGSYSRFFRKVDDSTYKTALLQDTVTGNQMKVERFEVSLKQKPDKTWEVANQELQDTFDKLYRQMPRDEKFFAFQSFSFNREGLKVTAGPGTLFTNYRNGELVEFAIAANELKYEFTPPADIKEFQQGHVYRALLSEPKRKDDMVFEPELLYVECDPVSCAEIKDSAFTGLVEAKLEDFSTLLRTTYDKAMRDADEFQKKAPFSGFRPPLATHMDVITEA